jgi:hypothetical protein
MADIKALIKLVNEEVYSCIECADYKREGRELAKKFDPLLNYLHAQQTLEESVEVNSITCVINELKRLNNNGLMSGNHFSSEERFMEDIKDEILTLEAFAIQCADVKKELIDLKEAIRDINCTPTLRMTDKEHAEMMGRGNMHQEILDLMKDTPRRKLIKDLVPGDIFKSAYVIEDRLIEVKLLTVTKTSQWHITLEVVCINRENEKCTLHDIPNDEEVEMI